MLLQTSGGMASLNLEHCLNIPDDFEGYSKTLFNIPKHYEDCVGNVLIPAGLVQVNPMNFHAKNLIFTRKIVAKKSVKSRLLLHYDDFFHIFV